MYFSFIGRDINTITFMICSLITYLEINVALQGKDKHISWRQIEKRRGFRNNIHSQPENGKTEMILYSAKDPDAGKDWSQKEKGMSKDEMVR